jgi:hypothetical protein
LREHGRKDKIISVKRKRNEGKTTPGNNSAATADVSVPRREIPAIPGIKK